MQFAAMRDRLEVLDRPRGKTLEILIAQLTAIVGNTSFRGFKEPLATKDFMVTGQKPAKRSAPRRSRKVRQETATGWGEFMHAMMKKQNG